jgi:hypothetical protein
MSTDPISEQEKFKLRMTIQTHNTSPVFYTTRTYSNGAVVLLSVDWLFTPGESVRLLPLDLLLVTRPDGSTYFLSGKPRDRA